MVPADGPRWDAFVLAHPAATFFHCSGWRRVLEEAFGQRTHYLLAERGNALAGVLPLSHQSSPFFGNALVSTPFCVYGGVVAVDDATRAALEQEAVEAGERLGVGYVEFRNTAPRRDDWIRRDSFFTFTRPIEPDPEQNLLAIPRKQRAEVRKGIQRGLSVVFDDDSRMCWELFATSVHRHGTPVYARRYFDVLKRVFGADCEFLIVRDGARPVASVLTFYFRDAVLPYYAGSAATGRDGEVHPFMYWSLMGHAATRGARVFDFGRSMRGSGTFAFKQNFGFEPSPLAYEVKLVRATHAPELDPSNPRTRLMTDVWRRLPRALVNSVGPWLSRSLG